MAQRRRRPPGILRQASRWLGLCRTAIGWLGRTAELGGLAHGPLAPLSSQPLAHNSQINPKGHVAIHWMVQLPESDMNTLRSARERLPTLPSPRGVLVRVSTNRNTKTVPRFNGDSEPTTPP